jgi:hypothetical protein
MPEGVFDKIKNLKSAVDVGNRQTEGLGAELAARSEMSGNVPPSAKPKAEPDRPQRPVPYTEADKPKGWKRISDSDLKDMTKPLGSLKHGTSHVPKTGVYKLHEGEAVIPKEKNTMNASDAMAGITGKAKPPKKIHKITTHKSDDGKMIHTHQHHHPAHHPDETHVSNNMEEATDHMAAMEPNMSAQPPEMPAPGADAGASGGAGASPTAQPGM